MTLVNAQCRLAARPQGLPKPSDWDYVEEPAPEPEEGQFRVEVEYVSLDPAMRSWMNAGRSYVPPVEIGEVMRAGAIGRVIDSRHPDFKLDEHLYGVFGVQRYAVSDGAGVTRVDTSLAPPPVHLGVLGISGLTAYFGLLDIGRPEPGQTVVVSGAAGSVGSLVGQIARIKGCRAIGIAGGAEKCRWLVDELGFDAAIDYKAGDLRQRLRDQAPDGVDVFFDNVGGDVLDDVSRMHDRVLKLQGHFNQANEDVRQIVISAEKVEKRGARIAEVEFDEDGAEIIPAPMTRKLEAGE
jgi:NADPH-dependent curcumin reductase CurA